VSKKTYMISEVSFQHECEIIGNTWHAWVE